MLDTPSSHPGCCHVVPDDEKLVTQVAVSEALKNQARNAQQAALFLWEIAKMRYHTAKDDLQAAHR